MDEPLQNHAQNQHECELSLPPPWQLRSAGKRVYKLPDVWMRPGPPGKGRKVPGTLEAHANGFRWVGAIAGRYALDRSGGLEAYATCLRQAEPIGRVLGFQSMGLDSRPSWDSSPWFWIHAPFWDFSLWVWIHIPSGIPVHGSGFPPLQFSELDAWVRESDTWREEGRAGRCHASSTFIAH